MAITINSGRPAGQNQIGYKLGKVMDRTAEHFTTTDTSLAVSIHA